MTMSRAPRTSAQPERQREEDRVARRDVGRRNAGRVEVAVARHGGVRGQRRAADGAQIDRELEVPLDAERARDRARRSTSRACRCP